MERAQLPPTPTYATIRFSVALSRSKLEMASSRCASVELSGKPMDCAVCMYFASCSALDCAGAAVWCSHTIETRRRHGLLRCGVRQRTERHRSSWQHGCDRSRLRSSLSPPSPCGIARRRRGRHHHRRRETSGRRGGGVRAGGLHWRRRYVTCGAISCTGTVPDWSPVCNGARLWLQWPTQGVPAGLC